MHSAHPQARAWSPSSDAAWTLLASIAWLGVAWVAPGADSVATWGLASTLLLCKALSVRPVVRAPIALVPTLAALQWLEGSARPALAAALAAASVYLVFTLARRGTYALRAWLETFRFRTPDGLADGWDYGQWLVLRERLLARLCPWGRRRILFPPTEMEADLRAGFRHRADVLRFAESTPAELDDHDMVVPLVLGDLERLRGFASHLQHNPLPLPDARCVAICNDKLAFNHALEAAGFEGCVPQVGGILPYPYVLKKRIDAWGDHTHVIAGPGDEHRLAAALRDPDYFRQAFVHGRREYAAHLLVRNGRIAAALTVEYGFAHALHKKCRDQPPQYRRVRRAAHLRLFRDMLAAIGFEGLCCVNYKVEDGRVRIFEVNPRFGASLAPWFFSMVRALPRARSVKARATTSAGCPRGA